MTAAVGESTGTIVNVRVSGPGRELVPTQDVLDIFVRDGVIIDIAPAGAMPHEGAILDAGGAWVIPGLWDHHVHVVQWSLMAEREPLGSAASAAEAARIMGSSPTLGDGRRVGTGFRDALWPDAPTRALLDASTGDVPTYLINADVHSVWLNSAALRREGFALDDSGVLREAPAFEISRRLNDIDPQRADDLVDRIARDAAARGVVGLVDLDMAWNEAAWSRRLRAGFDHLRVEFGIYPQHLDRALAEGLRTGDGVRGVDGEHAGLARVGALKVITDGSLGTRTAACTHAYPGDPTNTGLLTVQPGELVDLLTAATAAGLRCAVHAIGDRANSHALDAFGITGAWGSIEHAQLVGHADIPRFARLGVAASVQPLHALDDRDLSDRYWADQPAVPYPLRALADAGATLWFGSDAPVAPLDPWAGIAEAIGRSRDGREPWHPEQAIGAAAALRASTHHGGGAIEPGAVADLTIVGFDPESSDADALRTMPVAATMVAGRLTHLA